MRERSPSYMPPICGTVWCDSSMKQTKSSGKKSIRQYGRLARLAAVEDARVVLDAVAEAELAQHLHVELGALAQPVRLEQLALLLEHLQRSSSSSRISPSERSIVSRSVG